MIFITTYRIKQLSKDETKELMGVFADKGVVGTVKAHYQARGQQSRRTDHRS